MSKQITLAKTLKIASARKKDANPHTSDKQRGTTGPSGSGEVVIDLDDDIADDGAFLDGLSHEEAVKLEELPEVLDDFFDDEDDKFQNGIASDAGKEAQPITAAPSPSSTLLSASMIQPEILQGFDDEMGQSWVYPINYPLRDYQFNIVHKSLFKNTLVSLPTGLGKTFIAAVVMYNFYRWYPRGKVVFLAPTKPLVAQQIEACYKIVGIKQETMAEMTGNMVPARRKELWSTHRVFFLTPQVMQNDLGRHAFPAEEVACVVFDEAHKALGNHAYCQVIRQLLSVSSHFRVLALTATPGDDLKAVQQVVSNLLISQIELRSEDSFDIQPYTHKRKVEKIVVPLEGEIERLRVEFLKVLQTMMERLASQKVVYSIPADRVHKFQLLQARDRFRINPPLNVQSRGQSSKIEGDFALSISLYHAFELLELHGMRSFFHFLMSNVMKGHSGFRARMEFSKHPDLQELLQAMETSYGNEDLEECDAATLSASPRGKKNSSAWKPRPLPSGAFLYSHPKLQKLEEVVVQHFRQCEAEAREAGSIAESRVMIFSQYRDSVREIADLLSRHAPLVRVMSFVGQASASKGTKGLSQKEQLEVVRQFRQGGHNTLVSTCVGEEGLDIGEVDLIVCFDANKSPIRLVQRMGRTGRKRDGRIVELVTKGKEEQIHMKSESNKKHIHKAVREGCKTLQFYQNSPRMVPRHLQPQLHKMHFQVDEFDPLLGKKRTHSSSKGKEKQGRLSFGLPLPKKSRQILTDRELVQWTKKFALPEQEAARMAHHVRAALSPGLLCGAYLRHKGHKNKQPAEEQFHLSKEVCRAHRHLVSRAGEREEEVRLCDFGQWAEFQTAPGSVHLVPHSQRTKMYLTTFELMDVMQQDSTDAGASYEMEMRTFLNKGDINAPILSPPSEGDGGEGVLPVLSKRRARRAAIPSDEEDEDFMPAKKQLSLEDSESTKGSAKSAGVRCDAASPTPGEEEIESGSNQVGLHGAPLALPSLTGEEPVVYDREGSSPSGVGEAGTDVPMPPSFSELDWLDGATSSQSRSQLMASSGMDSSPRKMTSTPLKTTPSPPQDGCDVRHESHSFQPLASSTVERAAHATNVFKVPPAVSRRLSLSPSTQDTVLVSPELPFLGVKIEKKVEEGDGKEEGDASTDSAHAPVSAAVENLSTTVSCEASADSNNVETGCEQDCEDVNVVGESDMEEDGIDDPSTSILLGNSPSMDQDIVGRAVLTPQLLAPSCPATVCNHTGGGEGSVLPQDESPLNFQQRKRGKRMHRRQNILFSQISPSPKHRESLASVGSGGTPAAHKKKCHIVISDDGSDEDFESPLRKPEKRARAHFGRSDEDTQVEEPTALAEAKSADKEEDMIEVSSDDSAENWQKCERRKLSKKVTKEFVVDEAELSADDIVQYSSDEPDDPDCYDCKDSFINDATMLTQASPTCRQPRKARRGKPSPNMMGIYRQFLRSPDDVLFGSKGQRNGLRAGRCRMVLSQRHGVLRKYAKKAGFKVPFASPDQTVAPSSSTEEISSKCDTLSQDMDESSEAEEVQMLHYGEEEEEEEEEEEVEEEEDEGMEELETQDPDEKVAECVGEEAFALEMDEDEEAQIHEGTGPLVTELPSCALSFARREGDMEPSVGENQLYHEVLDDLLADDIPVESCNSLCARSPGLLGAVSPEALRDPHGLQPTAKQPCQHPVVQRSRCDTEERGGGMEGHPKFRILRPGASSHGEHTENVPTCIDKAPVDPVGPGIVKYTQGSKRFLFESMKAFSLGMEEWMVSSDEEEEESCKKTPEALHLRTEINNVCLVQEDDATFPSSPANQGGMHVAVSPLHAAQTQEGVSPSPPPSPIIGGRRTPDSLCSPIPPEPSKTLPVMSSSTSLQQLKQQAPTSGDNQIRIFADSRELSKSMIVTTLRQKHKVLVDVCQLSVCCFAVSYRMAIERRTVSELSASTSAGKIAERLKQMGQTYERRVLIVEKDQVKENKKMWLKATKTGSYYEHCLAQLLQTDITLLFSDGPEGTAQLLSQLAQSEFHKGQRIRYPYPTDPTREKMLKVILLIPVISVPLAVGLGGAYSCFADLLQCTPQDMCSRLPSLSLNKAAKIHYFFQHEFCPELA